MKEGFDFSFLSPVEIDFNLKQNIRNLGFECIRDDDKRTIYSGVLYDIERNEDVTVEFIFNEFGYSVVGTQSLSLMILKENSVVYNGLSFQSSNVFNLIMAMLFPSVKAAAKYDDEMLKRNAPRD